MQQSLTALRTRAKSLYAELVKFDGWLLPTSDVEGMNEYIDKCNSRSWLTSAITTFNQKIGELSLHEKLQTGQSPKPFTKEKRGYVIHRGGFVR